MIVVELSPGDAVIVRLAETDGDFLIDFAAAEPNRFTITAELPGNVMGGEGVIYEEEWDDSLLGTYDEPVKGEKLLPINETSYRGVDYTQDELTRMRAQLGQPKPTTDDPENVAAWKAVNFARNFGNVKPEPVKAKFNHPPDCDCATCARWKER
jgi:hypothetical protein